MPRIIDPYRNAAYQRQLWTPAVLCPARASVWYDCAQFNVACDGSGNVSQWNDLSGNGNHATQGTSGNRPAWRPAPPLGKPVITAAAGKFFATTSTIPAGDTTCYVVFEYTGGTGSTYRVWAGQSATTSNYVAMGIQGNTFKLYLGRAFVAEDTLTPAAPSVGYHVASFRSAYYSGTGNVNVITLDGEITTGSVSATTLSNGLDQILADRSSAAMQGDMAEQFIWQGRHTDQEMRAFEGYLAWKWGLNNKLAGSHPFANRPPLLGD